MKTAVDLARAMEGVLKASRKMSIAKMLILITAVLAALLFRMPVISGSLVAVFVVAAGFLIVAVFVFERKNAQQDAQQERHEVYETIRYALTETSRYRKKKSQQNGRVAAVNAATKRGTLHPASALH